MCAVQQILPEWQLTACSAHRPNFFSDTVAVIHSMYFTAKNSTAHGISVKQPIPFPYRGGSLPPKLYCACDRYTVTYRSDRDKGK